MSFKHPLAQNKEQFMGYTVFHLQFDGADNPIKFMTLADVKVILQNSKGDNSD